MKLSRVSYSKLNLFETCPLAFKLKYIDHMEEQVSESLAKGRVIHEVIARYNMHLLKSKLQTDVTIIPDLVTEVFYAAPRPLNSNQYNEVRHLLEQFATSHSISPEITVGVEEHIEGIQIDQDHEAHGIIDLLEIEHDRAIITDYKSDHRLRPQSEVDDDFQLAFYAWLTKRYYPFVEQVTAKLDFIRLGVTREVTFDEPEFAETEEKVRALVHLIERTETFEPRPSHFCGWCGYSEGCAQRILAGSKQILCADHTQAETVAQEILILEKALRDRQEALKAWVDKHGAVAVGDEAFDYHVSNSQTVKDTAKFMRMLAENGIEPAEYVRVDGSKLKKLLGDQKLGKKLRPLLVDSSRSTFKHKRLVGEEAVAEVPF